MAYTISLIFSLFASTALVFFLVLMSAMSSHWTLLFFTLCTYLVFFLLSCFLRFLSSNEKKYWLDFLSIISLPTMFTFFRDFVGVCSSASNFSMQTEPVTVSSFFNKCSSHYIDIGKYTLDASIVLAIFSGILAIIYLIIYLKNRSQDARKIVVLN